MTRTWRITFLDGSELMVNAYEDRLWEGILILQRTRKTGESPISFHTRNLKSWEVMA